MTIKLPDEVQDIIDICKMLGLQAHVAGGAARDLHYGFTPKDWDIIVLAPDRIDKQRAFQEVHAILGSIRYTPSYQYSEVSQAYENSTSDFNSRVQCLAQVEFRNLSVDIIYSNFQELSSVFAHFDANVNCCAVIGGEVWFDDGIPTELYFLRPLTPNRIARLYEIAEDCELPVGNTPCATNYEYGK